jgi:hypothetical protein
MLVLRLAVARAAAASSLRCARTRLCASPASRDGLLISVKELEIDSILTLLSFEASDVRQQNSRGTALMDRSP